MTAPPITERLPLLAAVAVVVAWFLWPFREFSVSSVAYALAAGGGLFLVAWLSAGVATESLGTGVVVRIVFVALIAFTVGVGAEVGLAAATSTSSQLALGELLLARALDAGACAVAAAVAAALRPTEPLSDGSRRTAW